jgi:hypothetical protein
VFLACHRKYELHYEERLEPVSRPAALSMGSAFQKAIELQDPEAGPLALDGHAPFYDADGARSTAVPSPAEPLHFHTQEAEDKHRINQAIVRAAAALYLRRWPSPVGEAREFEYRVRLRSPWTGRYSQTFDLQGFADGLIDPRTAADRGVPPRLRAGGEQARRAYRPDHRPAPPARPAAPARPVRHLAGHRTHRQQGALPLGEEAVHQAAPGRDGRRVHGPPGRRLRGREDFYSYEPPPSYITAADLLRIEAELWTWAEQLRALRRQRIYDRNTASCSDYGGCKYVPICSGDPDAEHLYHRREAS